MTRKSSPWSPAWSEPASAGLPTRPLDYSVEVEPPENHPSIPSFRSWREVWPGSTSPFARSLPGALPFPTVHEAAGCRFLTEPEYDAMFQLQAQVWGNRSARLLRARWDWLTRQNPFRTSGEGIVPAVVRNGRIMAYQICLPQTFRVYGRPWRIYLIGSLTADPARRGHLLTLWRAMRAWPVPMWGQVSDALPLYLGFFRHDERWLEGPELPDPERFGPPYGEASRPIFLHRPIPTSLVRPLRVDHVVTSERWRRPLNRVLEGLDRLIARRPGDPVSRELDRFPETLDPWLEERLAEYPLVLERSARYLNWRFVDFPQAHHRRFLFEDRSGAPIGIAVVEPRIGPRGNAEWAIADIVVARHRPDHWRAVLRGLLRHARHAGAWAMRAANPETPSILAAYRRLGFLHRRVADGRHVVLWRLPTPLEPDTITHAHGWFWQPADADHRLV